MRISELDLSVRAYNTLIRAGIYTVEILDAMSNEELLNIKNFNEKCLQDVKQQLRKMKAGKHWGCKYCDYTKAVPYPDEPDFLVCGRCGAEWLDCKVLVDNEMFFD